MGNNIFLDISGKDDVRSVDIEHFLCPYAYSNSALLKLLK